MGNIHKSREVYKYTPTATGKKLVPIRGLYVSGTHLEPYYIDHYITIDAFTTNEPTITDLTTSSVDFPPWHAISFIGADIVNGVNVDWYTTSSVELEPWHAISFIGAEIANGVDVEWYTASVKELEPWHAISFIGAEIVNGVDVDWYTTSTASIGIQPGIELVSFTATDVTVENIT